jgi:hypothetical protein|tara:strand:- start:46 stop:288 length:243 start_codon:yes stop_codon:yes gene_type:complete
MIRDTKLLEKLGNFICKKTDNIVENGQNENGKEVCDLDTGICYTIRSRDGLIERVDNSIRVNRRVNVESPSGQVKQLLNG